MYIYIYMYIYKEDKWITRLDTLQPLGMNEDISEFGSIYNSLFKDSFVSFDTQMSGHIDTM